MDIKSPWHWNCAECGGPILRLCASGPCQAWHDFDRQGRPVECGQMFNQPPGALDRLGIAEHEWDGGWVHTDPRGLCVCHHPRHGEDCFDCWTDVGRFLAGWHSYTPWEQIEKDHAPVYRALVGVV